MDESVLSRFGELIGEKMGLHFPDSRHKDLLRAVSTLSRIEGHHHPESYMQTLLETGLSDVQIEVLAGHLTTGETYFFRDQKAMKAFTSFALPKIVERKGRERRIRIWSAGCSTGEEPYTLAILLDRHLPQKQHWDIQILASDINPQALKKAKAGQFSKWSFRGTTEEQRNRYFTPLANGHFEIREDFRKRVEFRYINLITESFPSLLNHTQGLDVIFCRNVMIYLRPQLLPPLIDRFYKCLIDGGWFFVAPSETSALVSSRFVPRVFEDITIFQKQVEAVVEEISERSETWFVSPNEPDWAQISKDSLNSDDPTSAFMDSLFVEEAVSEDEEQEEERRKRVLKSALNHIERCCPEEDKQLMIVTLEELFHSDSYLTESGLYEQMARVMANMGRLEAALEWCRFAIEIDKQNPVLFYLIGIIQQELGLNDQALRSLKRSLYLDPQFISAHYASGSLLLSLGKTHEANRAFRNARHLLELLPSDSPFPESEGMTAGSLLEMIRAHLNL